MVPPGDGRALLDAEWLQGEWATPYEDGYALAGVAGVLPRAGCELIIKVDWYPLRAVPGFPALS